MKAFIVVRQLARLVSEFLFAKETLQRQRRRYAMHFLYHSHVSPPHRFLDLLVVEVVDDDGRFAKVRTIDAMRNGKPPAFAPKNIAVRARFFSSTV